jgi:hypothetical protein
MSPVALCLFLHFAKRVFEVMVVHKYSGNVAASIAGAIGVYYALITALIDEGDAIASSSNAVGFCIYILKV